MTNELNGHPLGGVPPHDHGGLLLTDGAVGALLDANGVIVGWSPGAEQLLALTAADVCGRHAPELLADAAAWPTLVAGRTAGTWSGEAVLRTGDGGSMKLDFQACPLAGPETRDETRKGLDEALSQGEPGGPGPGDRPPGPGRYFVLAAPAGTVARWMQDQAFTRELFLQDRVGLAVFDNELRLARTNTHLLPYSGVPRDLTDGRLGDFLQAEDAEAIERRLRDVLLTGNPLIRAEETARTLTTPGRGAVMAITAFRLQDHSGQVLGVTALFTDTTVPRRATERLALLQRATAAVGGSLSVAATADELAGVLVPGLADLAVVEIAEAVFGGEDPLPGADGRLALRRTAVVGSDGTDRPPTGVEVLCDPETVEDSDGAATTMTAALRARGSLLGRVTVHRAPGGSRFDPADLDLLREIALHAGLSVDNARRYTREHRSAVGLQRSLLPPSQSETAAVTTAGVYLPADTGTGVGGDWFDVIPLSSARVALVVGDVVGHGLAATATMGRLRTAVRTLADLDLEPDELLVHLDDLVSQLRLESADESGESDEHDDGDRVGPGPSEEPEPVRRPIDPIGATCLYAVYDPVSRRCTMASAGHPPPAVRAPDAGVSYVPVDPGPPLGVGGLPFETAEIEVEPGTLLALYTDGLVDSLVHVWGPQDPNANTVDQGMAELARRLVTAGGVPGAPLREIGREMVSGRPAHRRSDDVTLLLARTHAVPPEDTAAWPVEADPAAVAQVRALATGQLSVWGLDELAFTTELILSELVTNAIRYAGGPVEARLIRAGRLTCEVSDPSATQPRMRRARLTDEGGRGLYLVAQLSTRWGSRYTRGGKTIWAEQELPGGASPL
ncbi:SpoIIE family protein phosphatase [Streptomyces sp. NPDC048604]|uniref:ATP-binding SpoIIE family protein phosphatase n=1 Tax=Streptomyces sp. NPDC048604 TaxID=3365578 RepID=UPI00371EF216